jgi:hypothetical protein
MPGLKLVVSILTGLSGLYLIGLHIYTEILSLQHTNAISHWIVQIGNLLFPLSIIGLAIFAYFRLKWAKYLLILPTLYLLYGSTYAFTSLTWLMLPPPFLLTVAVVCAFTAEISPKQNSPLTQLPSK